MRLTAADNIFYRGDIQFLYESSGFAEGDSIVFFDKGDDVLSEELMTVGREAVSFFGANPKSVGSFSVMRGGTELHGQAISFCDDDGVCEPCYSFPCEDTESFLTCSDCPSGSADNYCDLERDSRCDPDCENEDGDCPACTACLFIDMAGKLCEDLGGEICDYSLENPDECRGGKFIALDDYVECCMGGTCYDASSYIEAGIVLQNQPSMVLTPGGSTAGSIQGELGDYCFDTLKGSICGPGEFCDGEEVEYYRGQFCCRGICIEQDPSAFYSESYISELYTEPDIPMTPEEIEEMYGVEEMEKAEAELLIEDYPEESYSAEPLLEGAFPHESSEEFGEDIPVFSGENFEAVSRSVGDSAEAVSNKVNLVTVALIILGVVLVVAIFIAVFRKGASSKVKESQEEISAAPTTGLQSQIDFIIAQGNDYKQAEEILLQKGFDKSMIDTEIRKNYQKRLEVQRNAKQVAQGGQQR